MQSSNRGREGAASRSETRTLIAASKVEGTTVYNRQGEALGSVYDVMIDKRSGDVAYAVMSFGGFLGIGKSYHPVPWNMLDYDESQSGYVVDVNKEMLENAPTFARSRTGRIRVTFVGSTIITAARTAVSDPLMLAAQPRMASHGWYSRASDCWERC